VEPGPTLAVRLSNAAKMLGLPVSSARDMVRKGILPSVTYSTGKRRKRVLVPISAIENFIGQATVKKIAS
jgi:hypothetical protein